MSESAVLGPEGGGLMDVEKREWLIRLVVDSVASGHSTPPGFRFRRRSLDARLKPLPQERENVSNSSTSKTH